MSLKFLESIRLSELEIVLSEMRNTTQAKTVLEIGAGTGWQAKRLAESGYSVEAIEIESSNYYGNRIWPVLDYDGKHIPFADGQFDVVFSSNVLEHIPELDEFQKEIQRVLNPRGIAIHVVPSGSWRFWTSLTHYPFIVKTLVKIVVSKSVPSLCKQDDDSMHRTTARIKGSSKLQIVKMAVIPPKHGEAGGAVTGIYYFSKRRWLSSFAKAGWKIERVITNRLFYTGYMILGPLLPVQARQCLSCVLGSSCHIFVLRKPDCSFQ